jgi:hypothetical protein
MKTTAEIISTLEEWQRSILFEVALNLAVEQSTIEKTRFVNDAERELVKLGIIVKTEA